MATKKTTLVVTDSLGGKHTRTTHRTYTHVALVRTSYAVEIAQLEATITRLTPCWTDERGVKAIADMHTKLAGLKAQTETHAPWGAIGWSSRRDLATKVVDQYRKAPSFAGALFEIVEVPAA